MDINYSGKVMFLGGTRSGKSRLAEQVLVGKYSSLSYLATAPRKWLVADENFRAKVQAHRSRRSANWELTELESPDQLYQVLASAVHPTLIDSVGTWIASIEGFVPDLDLLERAIRATRVPLVFVSEEVGLSVHPTDAVSREFVDALGLVNQRIASCVDQVFLVVAGRVMEMFRAEPI